MAVKGRILIPFTFSCFFLFLSTCYSTRDTLLQGKPLRDWERLVSANYAFTLGFFTQGSSDNRYLGIWYTRLETRRVWVANRNDPVPDTSGNLMIDHAWKLKIRYNGGSIAVSNYSQIASNTSAILQDNGNFILREHVSDGTTRVLWQSFDYPTDTLLPGMKLGINLRTGHQWSLTSWLTSQIPATGYFSLGADFRNNTQLITWWRGKIYWTSGFWHSGNLSFDNFRAPLPPRGHWNDGFGFRYMSNKKEMYFSFHPDESVFFPMFVLLPSGVLNNGGRRTYVSCQFHIQRQGCVKPDLPKCRNPASQRFQYTDGGYVASGGFMFDDNSTSVDCRFRCWNNCSCVAFSLFHAATRCVIWSRIQPRKYFVGESQQIYVLQTDKGNIIYFQEKNMKLKKKKKEKKKEKYVLIVC